MKVEQNTPLIMGNPRALEQVFTNLFTNAIQAMEGSGGILAVKVQAAETTGKRQYALVVVADNGPGIPKEYLERYFNPSLPPSPAEQAWGWQSPNELSLPIKAQSR